MMSLNFEVSDVAKPSGFTAPSSKKRQPRRIISLSSGQQAEIRIALYPALSQTVETKSSLDDLRQSYTEGMSALSQATQYQPYMEHQIDLFMGQLPSLLERFEGQYVAFEDGVVLAHGEAIGPILARVDQVRGEARPVLVRRVQADYLPIEM